MERSGKMTLEEYKAKHDKYYEKAEYYRKKLLKLESDFFDEMNKDNKCLKIIAYFGERK